MGMMKTDDEWKGGAADAYRNVLPLQQKALGAVKSAANEIDDVLTKLETDITSAKAKVDSADPDDPQEFLATITAAETQLGQISAPDALADLSASPRLQKAAARAANCQQLSAQNSSPPG